MAETTWLHAWLHEHDVLDLDDVHATLADDAAVRRAIELAEHDQTHPPQNPELGNYGIVAGRSLDLSGFLTCSHPDCRCRQVDRLFSRVWHYFDTIAVSSPDSHLILEMAEGGQGGEAALRRRLLSDSQVLLHVRYSGFGDMIEFASKPPSCPKHFPEARTLPGLQLSTEVQHRLLDALLRGVKVRPGQAQGQMVYLHPLLQGGRTVVPFRRLPPAETADESTTRRAARLILMEHWLGAASDLYTVDGLASPLGSGIALETEIVRALRPISTPDEVMFNLRLPVLDNLPAKELLALRQSDGAMFDLFRSKLRQAAKERLNAGESDDPEKVARDIEMDVIAPALAEISRRLTVAKQALERRGAISVGLAALATGCGLLGAVPLATGAGLAAAANAASAGVKHTEAVEAVRLQDMYFVWDAQQHAPSPD